jgi:hypothetical protein
MRMTHTIILESRLLRTVEIAYFANCDFGIDLRSFTVSESDREKIRLGKVCIAMVVPVKARHFDLIDGGFVSQI